MTLTDDQQAAGDKIAAKLSPAVAKHVVDTGNDQITKIVTKIGKIVDPKPKFYNNHLFQLAATGVVSSLVTIWATSGDSKRAYVMPTTPATNAVRTANTEAQTNRVGAAFNSTNIAGLNPYSMAYLTRDPAGAVKFVVAAKSLQALSPDGLVQTLSDAGSANLPITDKYRVFSQNDALNNGRAFNIPQAVLANPVTLRYAAIGIEMAGDDMKKDEPWQTNTVVYRMELTGPGLVNLVVIRDIGGDNKDTHGIQDKLPIAVFRMNGALPGATTLSPTNIVTNPTNVVANPTNALVNPSSTNTVPATNAAPETNTPSGP